jgi:hypothetical protein
MEMHVPPPAVLFAPNAGFLEGLRRRRAIGSSALRQADTSDDRHVAEDADMRGHERGLPSAAEPAEIEIELVER